MSWAWNFGSILGICLTVQFVSGFLLSLHYIGLDSVAFSRVSHLREEISNGWLLRVCHSNGASFFFIFIYLHLGRSLYYGSHYIRETWGVGVVLFLVLMIIAFTGYVLPWGQISYWGAAVITGLFSAIPYVGGRVVEWLWGGFSVGGPTLRRFFGFHFFLPFLLISLVLVHLIFLHRTGSRSPLGVKKRSEKINFSPLYLWKDVVGVILVGRFFCCVIFILPDLFGDVENFNSANSIITPRHIQPEWYYLFAYAILRAVPNKLGGVLALFISVLILFFIPILKRGVSRGVGSRLFFWCFVLVFLGLTVAGACPVEQPYIVLSRVLTFLYFSYFFINVKW